MPYHAKRDSTLLETLEAMFAGRSRRDLRQLVRDGKVLVNGAAAQDLRSPIRVGDTIECREFGRTVEIHPAVRLLHEDAHILVVEKGLGILSSGGLKDGPATVESVLRKHLYERGQHPVVYACHRLDRDVSGVLLLAKSQAIANSVRDEPRRILAERVYRAVVEGKPEPAAGTIRSHLADGPDQVVRPVEDPRQGKLCITHYRTLRSGAKYAELEVRLDTGRKNQIRAHLAEIHHPLAGDRKYGAKTDPVGRIALHAERLVITHPATGEAMTFEAKAPAAFGQLFEENAPVDSPRATR